MVSAQARLAAAVGRTDRLAHDMRALMARLKGALADVGQAADLAAARAAAAAAEAQADQALEIFRVMMDVAYLEMGEGPPAQSLRLDEAVGEVAELFAGVAEAADVRLALDLQAAPIRGDPELVRQLAALMLDNALRASPPGAQVRVEAWPSSAGAVLRVCDEGEAVPPGARAAVLDRFVPDPDPADRAAGLALALARAIAARHGGDLALEDAPAGLRLAATFAAP